MNANGRVNILNQPTGGVFNLYDKIPVKQMTSYREALTGNFENNLLSRAFFCAKNITTLQYQIINGVAKSSNGRFKIGFQDEDTLKIIMRSIFLQHASNLPTSITQQVEELNKLVLEYAIPQICSEAEGYIKYKNDVSTLPVPLSHGVSTYSNNILELKKFF